ncbi:C-type lectin domain-containing protein [Caenorhabditis elegans]|uniref:C-type lectin domain-containing protein n=1 Tax=Caenorhabditis elegans TaxID=6239 RepID=Q5WRN9_CAEEL|nr:C-type lectin domain-containing protein [Caenorhabditis elegans]CAH60781.3 C-type lectin domain-containing protein [Caenorhabditis elegans]|eukprot:NP_001023122.3 C-type LECtin [Caenorhabditis elegans]
MFVWLIFSHFVIHTFCNTNDHIEDFLRNKTAEDIIGLRQQYHRAIYKKKKEESALADASQPNLVLADGAVLPCEAGWHQFPDTGCCYRVSDAESEWHGGTAICKALNPDAEMASFHSQAESIFVANKYSTIHAWTGLSQTEIPNTWTYTDGTPDWHWFPALAAAPSDADSSCVEMMDGLLGLIFALSLQKGQTNAYSCDESIQIICKYCPRETTSTTTVTPTTTKAATIKTSTTTVTPTTVTTTKAPTTTKTSTSTTTPKFTTTTIQTTKKITTSPTSTTASIPITCTSNCPVPAVNFKGLCYKMCRGLVKFEDSCTWCNGTMATISSGEENDFVSRVFGSNDETTRQIWIGNTESSGYLNWSQGQPTKPNDGLDYCISMDLSAGSTRGKYKYLPCQSTVINSLCVMNP